MTDIEIAKLYELVADNTEAALLVHKLVKEYNTLLKESTHDVLTGLYNRRVLKDDIEYSVVVLCDLDDFKQINDLYGHDAGDQALVIVSRLLNSIIRSDDFVCRYGGDEFVIVLKHCDVEIATAKLERIRDRLTRLNSLKFPITMSFGVSQFDTCKTLEDAISEADIALYDSKQAGKNTISVYKPKTYKKLP